MSRYSTLFKQAVRAFEKNDRLQSLADFQTLQFLLSEERSSKYNLMLEKVSNYIKRILFPTLKAVALEPENNALVPSKQLNPKSKVSKKNTSQEQPKQMSLEMKILSDRADNELSSAFRAIRRINQEKKPIGTQYDIALGHLRNVVSTLAEKGSYSEIDKETLHYCHETQKQILFNIDAFSKRAVPVEDTGAQKISPKSTCLTRN